MTSGLRFDNIETGNWRLETGNWRLETGNWRLETGDWRLEDRRLVETGNLRHKPEHNLKY
jgi:hypothetical protein